MSTLKVTNIQDTSGGNSLTTAQLYSGSAKAWVNFNGSLTGTNAPRGSYNVSSVTRTGTGNYTINFSTALQDANYGAGALGGNGSTGILRAVNVLDITSTSLSVTVVNANTAETDAPYVLVVVFR